MKMDSSDSNDSNLSPFVIRLTDKASPFTRKCFLQKDDEDTETKLITNKRLRRTTATELARILKEHAEVTKDVDQGKDLMDDQITEIMEQQDTQIVELEEVTQTVDLADDSPSLEPEQITVNMEQAELMEQQVTQIVELEEVTQPVDLADGSPTLEPEQITVNMEQGKDETNAEHMQSTKSVEQAKDASSLDHEQVVELPDDSPPVDNEQISENLEQVGEEEAYVLREAFEVLLFPTLGEVQKKLLLQNIMNLEAEKGKELAEEWKALRVEQLRLEIKKLTYYAKLTEAIA